MKGSRPIQYMKRKRVGPVRTAFVDSSIWFAAAVATDKDNQEAQAILRNIENPCATDHVIAETWRLLWAGFGTAVADRFLEGARSVIRIETLTPADLEAAWAISLQWEAEEFSFINRTSFAAMERLGLTQAATFDKAFATYRYGRSRDRKFDLLR